MPTSYFNFSKRFTLNKELLHKSHFHFIGIGGIGMSAIAIGLLKKGGSVSGSDLVRNNETNQLEQKFFLEVSQSKLSNNFLEFLAKLLKEDMTSFKLEE